MTGVVLSDRGVLEVSGPDARALLQRLFTNDVSRLEASQARYAALLTPQGKVLVDFIVVAAAEGSETLLLDVPRALAAELARKLTLYRLRSQATIADRTGALGVAAGWPDRPAVPGSIYADPRHPGLGFRVIGPPASFESWARDDETVYRAHRIALGVPEGGTDFAYGEVFPHDANLDRLHGIDFKKGCYVGQEVVSRVEHRGTARKRVVAVRFDGMPPRVGADIRVGDTAVGTMGSGVAGHGLALVRTDRATEALAAGAPASADGIALTLALG